MARVQCSPLHHRKDSAQPTGSTAHNRWHHPTAPVRTVLLLSRSSRPRCALGRRRRWWRRLSGGDGAAAAAGARFVSSGRTSGAAAAGRLPDDHPRTGPVGRCTHTHARARRTKRRTDSAYSARRAHSTIRRRTAMGGGGSNSVCWYTECVERAVWKWRCEHARGLQAAWRFWRSVAPTSAVSTWSRQG